ncbi:MAG: apolipoprotein N-acyltransferase, partial [Bryobacteraceae bacterium]|nr:apolipoprotein N-acyltransferase [Bryobacteraceae bacterium]
MPRTAHVSPYSGSWYPGDAVQLQELLGQLWRRSEERTGCELQPRAAAFVVPHAGLIYSGAVAAAVYRRLETWKPRRVLLLGFSHRGGPPGVAIPDTEAYRTPLGDLEVDREAVADLLGCEPFRLVEERAVCDHSVEIQLPLLQRAVPEAKLVPLYVGDLSGEARERAAVRLAPWIGVYGLSFVFAMIAAAVTAMWLRRRRAELLWLSPLLLLWILPPLDRRIVYDREAVALQPNVAADARWDERSLRDTMRRLAFRTLQAALDPARPPASLTLWPEVPAPFYYYDDPQFRREVTDTARLARAPFLFGTVAYTPDREPLNSAVLLDAAGRLAGRYDKARLVPFGEFVPAGFRWIRKISSEAGDYAAGEGARVLQAGDHGLGVFICYESAFPDYVRQFAAQ